MVAWHEADDLARGHAEQTPDITLAHVEILHELVNSGDNRLILGGDRGRPAAPRFDHRVQQGHEFGHQNVQRDHLRRGPDGFGHEATRQVLHPFKGAALAVEVQARDVDGPPSADTVQQDLEFVAETHGLCVLSLPSAVPLLMG
ncbi:hypothetical protein ACFTY8_31960 [Streptomyces mirabilis]|uniref:hypothetical protein n=1 Tax=Streptomyces mirabilis TaxID=68239 RepID=UPI003637E702